MKLEHMFVHERGGSAEFLVGKSIMKTVLTDEEHDAILQAIRPIYNRALHRFHADVKSELIEAPKDITPQPALLDVTPFDEEIPF